MPATRGPVTPARGTACAACTTPLGPAAPTASPATTAMPCSAAAGVSGAGGCAGAGAVRGFGGVEGGWADARAQGWGVGGLGLRRGVGLGRFLGVSGGLELGGVRARWALVLSGGIQGCARGRGWARDRDRGWEGLGLCTGLGPDRGFGVLGPGAGRASPGWRVRAEPHVAPHLPAGCSCDPRGTLASHCAAGTCTCDRSSGTCACRPNVVGKSCDRCAPHFWSLGGPGGCEPCGCHPTRALHPACETVSPWYPGMAPLPSRRPVSRPAEHASLAAGDGAVPVPAWLWGPRLLPVPGASLGRPRAGVPRWGRVPGIGGAGALGTWGGGLHGGTLGTWRTLGTQWETLNMGALGETVGHCGHRGLGLRRSWGHGEIKGTWWVPLDMGDPGAVVGCWGHGRPWGHGGFLGTWRTQGTLSPWRDCGDIGDPGDTVGLWRHGDTVGWWGHGGTLETRWHSEDTWGHATTCLHSL